jgi:hypothetical protein
MRSSSGDSLGAEYISSNARHGYENDCSQWSNEALLSGYSYLLSYLILDSEYMQEDLSTSLRYRVCNGSTMSTLLLFNYSDNYDFVTW